MEIAFFSFNKKPALKEALQNISNVTYMLL